MECASGFGWVQYCIVCAYTYAYDLKKIYLFVLSYARVR